jgi:hypothetical protein
MDHFFNSLQDVSVKETSVCIVDDTCRVVREMKWRASPKLGLPVLNRPGFVGGSNS